MYSGVGKIFALYWRCYGGWSSLLKSPYLHISVALAIVCFPLWVQSGWWNLVISVIPSILGFSLGGFAIFLAIGDARFRALTAGSTKRNGAERCSPFMSMNATFVHFIVLQFFSLILAIVSSAIPWPDGCMVLRLLVWVIWFFAFLIFVYAVVSALAAAMVIFRNADLYDRFLENENKRQNEKERAGAAGQANDCDTDVSE